MRPVRAHRAGACVIFWAVGLLSLWLGQAQPAMAQALDPASAAALAETLRMLSDPSGRGAATTGNPAARDVDRQVQALAGSSENAQAVYQLAGEVFADLVRSTGGDMNKLMEILGRANSDPNALASALSPATQARLRELSGKIPDARR